MPKSHFNALSIIGSLVEEGVVCPITGEERLYKDPRMRKIAYKHHQKKCEYCAKHKLGDNAPTQSEIKEDLKQMAQSGKVKKTVLK
tara:strand:+ start:3197 stop:3454 length:258 start_codon:yes stop_codon:yes gene_type:complete